MKAIGFLLMGVLSAYGLSASGDDSTRNHAIEKLPVHAEQDTEKVYKAQIDTSHFNVTKHNHTPVTLIKLNGKLQFRHKSLFNIKPGKNIITLAPQTGEEYRDLMKEGSGLMAKNILQSRTFELNAKHCMRYYFAAKYKNRFSNRKRWTLDVIEKPIKDCEPEPA